MDLDHKLCYCYQIPKRKIVNFVKQTMPPRASQISQCFEAGSGCGWCIPFLIRIHRQVLSGAEVESDDISPAEYEALRSKYIAAVEEGTACRNEYGEADEAAPVAGAPPGRGKSPPGSAIHPPARPLTGPPEGAGGARGKGPVREKPFDYTRYFSRARPDPEPETIEPQSPRPKKGG